MKLNFKELVMNIESIFDERICGRDYFCLDCSNKEFLRQMNNAAEGKSSLPNDICTWLVDDYDYDIDELLEAETYELIKSTTAEIASDILHDWDEDDEDE